MHKQWTIRVEVQETSAIVVEACTKGELPTAKICHTPDRALDYIDGALASFQRGDSVAIVLVGSEEPAASCLVPNKHIALNWLAGRLVELWDCKRMASMRPRSVTSKSGVVAVVDPGSMPPAKSEGSSGTT
jgi:hypothetical protein